MVKEWTGVKKDIERLYHVENKPLTEVMRLIKGLHEFHASERSYRTQLQKWGFLKYNTEANPRVRNGAAIRKAGTRRRPNVQPTGPPANSSSTSMSSNSQVTFEPSIPGFPLGGINNLQWNFETEAPIESTSTSYTDVQYSQAISDASMAPVQYAFELDDVDPSGQTALHWATVTKDIDQTKSLVEKGAAVHIKDNSGNQPLHYAITSGDMDIVRLLLRYGADINAAGNRGLSPLHLAISRSDNRLAELLLEEGASITSQDDNGDSALHLAVSPFSAPKVDILLMAKADTNIPNAQGFTPFHKLLNRDYFQSEFDYTEYEYMSKFIESGASVHLSLPNGVPPLELFLARSKFPWQQYTDTSSPKDLLLQSFIKHGADPTTRTPSREPLILQFISKCLKSKGVYRTQLWRDFKFLDLLCKHVQIGPIKKNGDATLHELALVCGHWSTPKKLPIHEAMEILLSRGEDPNRQNSEGETPLSLLFTNVGKSSKNQIQQCLRTLVEHGADPMILRPTGKPILFAAAKTLNSYELKMVLTATLELEGSTDPVPRSERHGLSRFIWKDWEQAVREDNWEDAKTHVLSPSVDIPHEIAEKLRVSAFQALGERHINLVKTMFEGESDKKEKQRALVATIIRDYRLQNFEPELPWVDFLLTLC